MNVVSFKKNKSVKELEQNNENLLLMWIKTWILMEGGRIKELSLKTKVASLFKREISEDQRS